jgi:hypothetical protein
MVRISNFVNFGPILAQFRSKQLKIRPGIQIRTAYKRQKRYKRQNAISAKLL